MGTHTRHDRQDILARKERRYIEKCQQVQDFLSDLVKVNLALFDSEGNYLTVPSKATGYCNDFVRVLGQSSLSDLRCATKAFGAFLKGEEKTFACKHGLKYAGLSMARRSKHSLVLVVGPFLLGKRESENFYRDFCKRNAFDSELFCDHIREVPVFSQESFQTIINLAHSVMKDPCESCELYLMHNKD